MMALDAVHQLHRFALGRDDVEPAAGDHHLLRQAEHVIGDGIAVMVIVEEPAIVVAVAQRSLNFGKIHAWSIVNDKSRKQLNRGFTRMNTDQI